MSRSPYHFACLGVVALVLVACGDDEEATTTSEAAPTSSTGAAATTATDSTVPGDDTTAYPLTLELCRRDWTYERAPERIVATDTPMLDLALMLGLGDRVVGYFGDVDNLDPSVQEEASELQRLGDNFPYPTLEAVLAGEPDLVLSYGYNDEAGFTAERLQDEGIGNFTVTEGCDDFDGSSTIESWYEDVRTLASITGAGTPADDLIAGWEARVAAVAEAAPSGDPIRVLNTGSGDPAAPFVSASRSVAHDLIDTAGGADVFGDTDEAYLSPTWEEVVARDPQLIIESSGFGEQGLADVQAYLAANPALSTMAAVTDDNFGWMSYEEGVPGPQMFTGLEKISTAIVGASAGS